MAGSTRAAWRTAIALTLVVGVADLAGTPLGVSGQDASTPIERALIVVPGILFRFQDQGQEMQACDRIRDGEHGFGAVYDLLTNPNSRFRQDLLAQAAPAVRSTLLPAPYSPNRVYAFDYAATGPGDVGAPCGERGNGKSYFGPDTRRSLDGEDGSAARFDTQFAGWKASCGNCHFDIIAHSLGGAVVATWLAGKDADDEDDADDLRRVHAVITVDSPVNGAVEWLPLIPIWGLARLDTRYFRQTDDVIEDLNEESFVARMRTAPGRVDMVCISNVYDALVTTHMATVERQSGGCRNQPGFYSDARTGNPWLLLVPNGLDVMTAAQSQDLGRWFGVLNPLAFNNLMDLTRAETRAAVYTALDAAHVGVLGHTNVHLTIAMTVQERTPYWEARNKLDRAKLVEPVRSPTTEPGNAVAVAFQLRNTGANAWDRADGVVLAHVGGTRFDLEARQPMPIRVEPGEEIRLTLRFRADPRQRIKSSTWRLARGPHLFGPEVRFTVSTFPDVLDQPIAGGSALLRRAAGDAFGRIDIEGRLERAVDRQIADTRRDLQRRIEEEAEQAVDDSCGAGASSVLLLLGLAASAGWRRRFPRDPDGG